MIRRLIILLLIVGCEEPSQHGCLDSQACNYDADATIDNNSCIYEVDCVGVCGGEDISCVGCDEIQNSGLVFDECGVCDGNNSPLTGTCDCAGTPDGTATADMCGTCDGDTTNDCILGCDDVWGSGIVLDECGNCGGEGILILGECYSISTTDLSLHSNGYGSNIEETHSTFPDGILRLTNLTYLYIYGTQITSLPDSINILSKLEDLIINHSQLSSIPDNIDKLINLTRLELYYNQLTSLPESIGNLSSLTRLELHFNKLTTLPESICNIYPNLATFRVEENNICGTLPSCLTADDIGEQNCP